METKAHSQLELFSQVKESRATESTGGNPFFIFIRSYEKVVLVIIGLIITAAAAFCVGVEKGKRLGTGAYGQRQIIREQKAPIAPAEVRTEEVAPKAEQAPVLQPPVVIAKQKTQETLQGYIIQIATYQSKSSAQKEAEVLKKKGFFSSVLSSKKGYNIVCIGGFSNKEQAKSILTELKKQYQDCFIRRL